MSDLLDRLQVQARDDIATKIASLTRELEEHIAREFPPPPKELPPTEGDEEAEQLLEGLSGAEAAARSSARDALRDWLGALKGELEEGAMSMLDAVSRKNPAAFDGSLPPDKESLLFDKVTEGVRHTVDQIIQSERGEIERRITALKKRP